MTDNPSSNHPDEHADAAELVAAMLRGGVHGVTSNPVHSLMDVAAGVHCVVTREAMYFVDLDASKILRVPRMDAGAEVDFMRGDGDWVRLVSLESCTVGRPMLMVLDLGLGSHVQTMRGPTSPIEQIDQLSGGIPNERTTSDSTTGSSPRSPEHDWALAEIEAAFAVPSDPQLGFDLPLSIMDEIKGSFVVFTKNAFYLIDLGAMKVVRAPREVVGRFPNPLPRDGKWVRILSLGECTVGRALDLLLGIDIPGKGERLRTSDVELIVRIRR